MKRRIAKIVTTVLKTITVLALAYVVIVGVLSVIGPRLIPNPNEDYDEYEGEDEEDYDSLK